MTIEDELLQTKAQLVKLMTDSSREVKRYGLANELLARELVDLRTRLSAIQADANRALEAYRAERARLRAIVDAAVAFRHALDDEEACCVDEHNALFGAVNAYLGKPDAEARL